MKIINYLLFLLFLIPLFIFPGQAYAKTTSFASNQIIVKYKVGQSPEELKLVIQERNLDQSVIGKVKRNIGDIISRLSGNRPPEDKLNDIRNANKQLNVILTKQIFKARNSKARKQGLQNIRLIKVKGNFSVNQLISKYKALPEILYAEKVAIDQVHFVPDDPWYSQQWALGKIDAQNAWDVATGSSQTTVAVIDTGIDYNHADLPTDIIKGYNYASESADPLDDNGHGTIIAGIIGALTNNGVGVSGINHKVKLMAIKALDSDGQGYSVNVAAGIEEATDAGAKIINLSLGHYASCEQFYQDAIDYAYQQGVIVVTSVGEGSPPTDEDITPHSPSSCQHVISVAATGPSDQRASYSDYGDTVDIAAPGGDNALGTSSADLILSTYFNNQYGLGVGTSFATPQVSGLAALIFSRNPTLSPDVIKSLIKKNADSISTDFPIGRRVNAFQSLLATPLRVATPSASVASDSATISWSIPEATTSSKVEYGWSSNYDQSTSELDTSPMVIDHSVTISPLAPCETLHYRVRSKDFWGIESVSPDYTSNTSGCTVDAPVLDVSSSTISTSSGGTTSLLNSGFGITLNAPISFASSDANFQIKQLSQTEAMAITSSPSAYTLVGDYFYELKAFSDLSTSLSTFDNLITVTINYDSSDITQVDESTLKIFRWDGGGWTQLTGCAVDTNAKAVSCTTQNFSDFALFGQATASTPTLTPTPGSSSDQSSSSTSSTCSDVVPSGVPNLFQINTTNTTAQLYFTSVPSNISYYFIAYGYTADDLRFGVSFNQGPSSGVSTYAINYLSPNTTYYFKIRGGNGCSPGNWGNSMKALTGGSAALTTLTYANGQTSTQATSSVSGLSGINTNSSLIQDSIAQARSSTLAPTGNQDILKLGIIGSIVTAVGALMLFL